MATASSTSSVHAAELPRDAVDRRNEASGRLRPALLRAVELVVLWSLAVAQPVLDVLGRYPEFFDVHGSTAHEVVAFAVGVVLLPPLLLWIGEVALYAVGRRAGDAAHLALVGVLIALLVLHAVARHHELPAWASLAVAGAAGAAAAVAHARHRAPRLVLRVLAPLPLAVLLLFLFASPTSALVTGNGPLVAGAAHASRVPVVVIVFDELSTVSLLNRAGRIDTVRYPSFGALAADSTWFRNATTVDGYTERAVPAVLTGLLPQEGLPPVYTAYPHNLFTLLGKSHEIRAIETGGVRLCPDELCPPRKRAAAGRSLVAWTQSIASDAGIVYLRGTLPERFAERLPDLSTTWGFFGSGEPPDAAPPPRAGVFCGRSICDFAAMIAPAARPRLYFLHTLLPHTPWVYLPDGRRYPGDARRRPPGVDTSGLWSADPAPALVAYQRHLLQLGYADFGLGLALRALKKSGLYDDALIVVTADHGVNYRPGETRRLVSTKTIDQIAFVPLLVKLPGQTDARVLDRLTRAIDIVPTIADALRVRIPWHVDGRSLLRRPAQPGTTVALLVKKGVWVRAPLPQLVRRRAADLERQVALFGDGPPRRIFALGGERTLRLRRVGSLRVAAGPGTVSFAGGHVLVDVDPASSTIPAYAHGTVSGTRPRTELAIAVNGVVAGVTQTYADGGAQRFSVMLDPRALRAGTDRLTAFAVDRRGPSIVLRRLDPT